MKITPRCLAAIIALAWVGSGIAARAQAPVYTANATIAVPQSGVEHFLQVVNLAQGPGIYTLNRITFAAYFETSDVQTVLIYFYTGVDTSPSATNALANATRIGALRTNLRPNGPVPQGYAFPIDLNPVVTSMTDGGSIGVEVFLLTTDLASFSSTAYGRFTNNPPTLGSSAGYVWNDVNYDSVFAGVEQTRFGMTYANTRLELVGSLVQPTPSLKTFARIGTAATLTVDSYTGVNYQLQRATSLTAGDWTNIGSAVAGSTGTVLTFTDRDSTDPQAFYRVMASLPTAGARAAGARKSSLGL